MGWSAGTPTRCSPRITLIAPDAALLADAADLDPISLRALDAIHLATAVTLVPDIDGIVVYDLRLADAARQPV